MTVVFADKVWTMSALACLVCCAVLQANACRARLQAAIAAAAGPCVAVTPAAATTFARLQLLYFASPGHDLSMSVGRNMSGRHTSCWLASF